MDTVAKDLKLPIYSDTSYQIGIDNAHTYGELFLLIKDGKGLPTTSKLNERQQEEIDGVQNLKKSYIHNHDARSLIM